MREVFGEPRVPRSEILQQHSDLAASVQAVLEENYFALLNFVQKQTKQRAICLAGGVALNCVANGMIFERSDFRDVYGNPLPTTRAHPWAPLFTYSTKFSTNHAHSRCDRCTTDPSTAITRSGPLLIALDRAGVSFPKMNLLAEPLTRSLAARSSAGFRDGWSSDRGL
ncbi:MAG: carbamoyltransferase N-terminal domain-containing protein [Bryobacteraceae bacterium]